MASEGALPVEKEWQQIKREITCSICGNPFTDPRTIPCLHTFCKQCIEKSIESNKSPETTAVVCCPLCRAPLPQNEIASVPANFTIIRLLEIFGKREGGKSLAIDEMKCGTCEGGLSAVTWCIECENSLCQDCNEMHKKWKAFKLHKLIAVKEFIQNPKLVLSTPEKPEACKSHSKQSLDLYCKTCGCVICRDCTLKDHPRETHDFDFIDAVVDDERDKIKQATAPFKQLLEQVRNTVKRIEDFEKQVDIRSDSNTKKIQDAYGEVYKLLKQQQQEALEKVNALKMSFKETLAMQKENAKFMESQLVSCEEFSDDAISTNRTRQLLAHKNLIIDRMEDLIKQVEQANINPECELADSIIVTCGKPAEFISDSLCHVSGLPHLLHCSVRGPLAISNPVKVTIKLKDICGSSVVNQSKDLEIFCNKEGDFLQNVTIEEQSNGVYCIRYNPQRKEDHLVSVHWKGIAVNQEEINVSVNARDYANVKQDVKVIGKYGSNSKQLSYPYLMANGLNNELIVGNDSINQLVIFDEQLQYSHVIGGSGKLNGKFQCITGIAVDNKGYLYVADGQLHCIQKFAMNGKFITQFGSAGTAEGQFKGPHGLACSQSEMLFVCDCNNHRIQIFKDGLFSHTFGQYGKEPCSFNSPRDLTLSNYEDQLFVTDSNNNRIQVFTLSGQFLRMLTGTPFKLQRPVGIFHTLDNYMLISSSDNHVVLVLKEDGTFVSAIEGTYKGKKRFTDPCGVIMMNNGQIVVASSGTNKLIVF